MTEAGRRRKDSDEEIGGGERSGWHLQLDRHDVVLGHQSRFTDLHTSTETEQWSVARSVRPSVRSRVVGVQRRLSVDNRPSASPGTIGDAGTSVARSGPAFVIGIGNEESRRSIAPDTNRSLPQDAMSTVGSNHGPSWSAGHHNRSW